MRRALAIVIVLILAFAPAFPQQDGGASDEAPNEDKPSGGRLAGRVRTGAGGPEDIVGARVLAYHLDSDTLFASEPLGSDGKFEIPSLPRGVYDLAVETPTGVYVSTEVAHLRPSAKIAVDFELVGMPAEGPPPGRERFTGSDASGAGLASASRRLRGKAFWKSPKGLAIIGGIGAAALLAIAVSGDSSDELEIPSSPF